MVLSSGLALIYGLRGITNFAHGGLFMAGAYLAVYDALAARPGAGRRP